jgi:hypothetical protein
MNINELSKKIESKKDFEEFLKHLKLDFETNKKQWENIMLKDFLESLDAYTEDVEGYFENMNIPFDERKPTWKIFAQLLLGARGYE